MSLFGDELRRLRRGAGLSQETLAARAGLSPEAVSLLERGRRSPRLTTMRLLAEAMGVSDVDRHALFATAQLPADAVTTLPIFPDRPIGRTAELERPGRADRPQRHAAGHGARPGRGRQDQDCGRVRRGSRAADSPAACTGSRWAR